MDLFVRFYLVPGLSHGFGPFNAKYDGLGLLDSWVESRHCARHVCRDGRQSGRSHPADVSLSGLASLQRLRL